MGWTSLYVLTSISKASISIVAGVRYRVFVRQSLLTGGAVEFGKRILKGLRRASSPHFVSHSDF